MFLSIRAWIQNRGIWLFVSFGSFGLSVLCFLFFVSARIKPNIHVLVEKAGTRSEIDLQTTLATCFWLEYRRKRGEYMQ